MNVKIQIFILLIIFCSSCCQEEISVIGTVTSIEYSHLGKGKYKKEVYYSYSYEGEVFEHKESIWYKDQTPFSKGDSIKVTFCISTPENAELVGSLMVRKPVKTYKLKSKKK